MMPMKRRVAFVCYLCVSLLLMGFGVRYYFGGQLMSYHLEAIGVPWESLPETVRFMFLLFMQGVGVGFICVSAAMLAMLFIPFRRGERWADLALPGIGLAVSGMLSVMMCSIMQHTTAEPPMTTVLVTCGVLLFAAALTLLPCCCCSSGRD
jgi:peptidoglycan/LPS O-acetylase OafA/YrhL